MPSVGSPNGAVRNSGVVLMLPRTVVATGPIMNRQTRIRMVYRAPVPKRDPKRLVIWYLLSDSVSAVVALHNDALVAQRKDQGDDEQDHGDGAADTDLETHDAKLIQVGADDLTGVHRPALREYPDEDELLERPQDGQKNRQANGAA